mgnify:CR=1 FL=1
MARSEQVVPTLLLQRKLALVRRQSFSTQSADCGHLTKTVGCLLRADCVEKLCLFWALMAGSLSVLMRVIYRDDGTKAGSAGGLVL